MSALIKPLNGEMVLSLSDDVLDALGLAAGDTVEGSVDESGALRLETTTSLSELRLQRAREFMDEYQETLDILAK